MIIPRLAVVFGLAIIFGAIGSRVVGQNIDLMETHSTTMTLCDSAGRRPCP